MCRFLLAKSDREFAPLELLNEFASMCKNTPAPNGDWQGDGWGIAWQEEGEWQVKKSLSPIWEEKHTFAAVPPTSLLVAHARSAGFARHKGNIEYNQPYLAGSLCFVFNGMVRGVKLARPLAGAIGAQKMFSFLQEETRRGDDKDALSTLCTTLRTHAARIEGLNVGLVRQGRFSVLCEYTHQPEYFRIHYHEDAHLTLICSSALPSYSWEMMEPGEIRAW